MVDVTTAPSLPNVPDMSSSASNIAPPSAARLSNTTACLPIIYGSAAVANKDTTADEYHTHKWTLYLRAHNNEDLSPCIEKVIFNLHPSFAQPVRELTHPPYQVTETGWGEFEAQLRIVWKDSSEKPTVLNHGIKLYPPGLSATTPPAQFLSDKPVIAEKFDEVIFTNPHETFHLQLQQVGMVPPIEPEKDTPQGTLLPQVQYSDQDDMSKLVQAQGFLAAELQKVKDRLLKVDKEMEQVDAALAVVGTKAPAGKKGGASVAGSKKQKGSGSAGNAAKRSKTG